VQLSPMLHFLQQQHEHDQHAINALQLYLPRHYYAIEQASHQCPTIVRHKCPTIVRHKCPTIVPTTKL
jgi:hypothetical protein